MSQMKEVPFTVIEPREVGHSPMRELIDYRELLYFLTWRDIKVRYKQTVLGAAWAVLQPLTYTVVFTIFLGNLRKCRPRGPYSLFVFAGLLPWTFFSNRSQVLTKLSGSPHLITKYIFQEYSFLLPRFLLLY